MRLTEARNSGDHLGSMLEEFALTKIDKLVIINRKHSNPISCEQVHGPRQN